MIVAALCASAAVLLVVAGVAKIRMPAPAGAMIGLLLPRVARRRAVARLAGAVEVASGAVALAVGGRIALCVLAGCYFVLTAVAVRLATGPQRAPCGCFGAADGTVGVPHVAFDTCCLAAAVAGAVRPPGSVLALFDGGTLAGVTVVAQVLLLATVGYLSITALPALAAARRDVEGIR